MTAASALVKSSPTCRKQTTGLWAPSNPKCTDMKIQHDDVKLYRPKYAIGPFDM